MPSRTAIFALATLLCLASAVYAAEVSAEERIQLETQRRYDQCQARVHARCHEERERCANDCQMYAETSAKCPAEKCKLMHRACHRLYSEACDDSHPVNWVPLGDLSSKAQEQQDICKDRVSQQCTNKRSECQKTCDEETGANKCNELRCEVVHSECQRSLVNACRVEKTIMVVDQTPGRYCIEHPKTCQQANAVTPDIVDKCENGCVQTKSWSDVTSCDECQKTVALCYENCKGGLCQAQNCIQQAEGCRLKCPMVKALSVGKLKLSNIARTQFIKPITEPITV